MDNSEKFIEDLSFSNLVNIIQNDEDAKTALNRIASEMDYLKLEARQVEQKRMYCQQRMKSLMKASHRVCKIIQRPIPLAVMNKHAIVVVGDKDITIEGNVI